MGVSSNFNVSAKSDALQAYPPFTQTWTMSLWTISQVVRFFAERENSFFTFLINSGIQRAQSLLLQSDWRQGYTETRYVPV